MEMETDDAARRETIELSKKRRMPLDPATLEIGTRVRVWWAGDEVWFSGEIISIGGKRGHRILYDDGEKKYHDLSDPVEVWELESAPSKAQNSKPLASAPAWPRAAKPSAEEAAAPVPPPAKKPAAPVPAKRPAPPPAKRASSMPAKKPVPPPAKKAASPPPPSAAESTSTFDAAVSGLSGKRKVVPTQVQIGNQFVKRQNLYDMDTGETSGFRLDDTYDDAFLPQERKTHADRPQPSAAKPRPQQQPRQQSAAEKRRLQMNEALRRDQAEMVQRRARFFHENRARIEPFCEPKVLASLAKAAAAAPPMPPKRPLDEQPDSVVGGEMRDYQLVGLDWMADSCERHGLSPILGDEMGLGKTLQTISVIAHMARARKLPGAALVVCPLSVLSTWCAELKRWAPSLRAIKLHSSDTTERERLRSRLIEEVGEYDVVVTTYEMVKSPALQGVLVQKVHWRLVVLDEGHVLKNSETEISKTVRKMHFVHALLLTGTPLQNNLTELWALLNLLYPEVFTTTDVFDEAFNIGQGKLEGDTLRHAHQLLQLLMLRRLKENVAKALPPKLETLVSCPLDDAQLFWYRRLLLKDSSVLSSVEGDASAAGGTKYKSLMNLLMQLRKCCDHPFLFAGAEDDPDETSLEELVGASGKLRVLDRLLLKLHKGGHRVVLFSQFAKMVDLLDDYCTMRGFNFVRLTGSTNRVQRMVNLQAFNAPSSKVFLFLMTTRAGGLGINLQTADTCILFDSDWNPQCDLQAMARVHRVGQTKPVHVYRLVSGGTAEERVVQRAQKKLYLSETVNRGGGGDDDDELEKLSGAEVMSMIKFGAAAVFAGGNREPTDAELDAIIDRTRTGKEDAVGGLAGGKQLDAASMEANFADSAPVSTRQLYGQSFEVPKSQAEIGNEFRAILQGARERKSRIKMVASEGSGYGAKYVPVLASNNYSLNEGEGSVFQRELGGHGGAQAACAVVKRKLSIAGRDYAHETSCLACFASGGKATASGPLLTCKLCPMVFHRSCAHQLGCSEVGGGHLAGFTCPHHNCSTCGRKSAAAGGMLFRCEACPATFCEDCLPREANIVGGSARLEARGVRMPAQACYIRCSTRCEAFMQRSDPPPSEETPFEPLELDEIGAETAGEATEQQQQQQQGQPEQPGATSAEAATAAGNEEAGSSFAKLFGTVVAAHKAADASSASAFETALRAALLVSVTYDDEGEPCFVLDAHGRKTLARHLRAGNKSRLEQGELEQGIAAAIADGSLLQAGESSGDLVASPALAASLQRVLEEQAAAEEAQLAKLVERTRDGIVRAARKCTTSTCSAHRLPQWSIPIPRIGDAFGRPGEPFCKYPHVCAASETLTQQGHVCSLFGTDEERELCPRVFARLCEEGTLSLVRANGAIAPGDVFDPTSDTSKQWRSYRGFTVARTESVARELAELAERAAAREREQAARRERKRARQEEEQRAAEQAQARLRARFPQLAAAGHDELVAHVKPLIRPSNEEFQASGLMSLTDASHKIGCGHSDLGKWMGRGSRLTAHLPQNPEAAASVEHLVRKWLKRRPDHHALDKSALETRAQLQAALEPYLIPGLDGAHGKTQTKMGEELGLTAQQLSAWLNGGWPAKATGSGPQLTPFEPHKLAEMDDTVREGLMRRADAESPEAAAPPLAAAPEPTSGYAPGQRVRVSGLQGRPELNGQTAVVKSYDPGRGRYVLLFGAAQEQEFAIKPDNLQPAAPAAAAASAEAASSPVPIAAFFAAELDASPVPPPIASQDDDEEEEEGEQEEEDEEADEEEDEAWEPLPKGDLKDHEALVGLLKSRGDSQAELGRQLKVSPSQVSNWMLGVRMGPEAMSRMDAKVAALLSNGSVPASTPADDEPGLLPGQRVLVSGLQGRPDLNGQTAVIQSFDFVKKRWVVQFGSDEQQFALKADNLQPAA